jgi:hypothetical protein
MGAAADIYEGNVREWVSISKGTDKKAISSETSQML